MAVYDSVGDAVFYVKTFMVPIDDTPTITDDELDYCVRLAQNPDAAGVLPGDAGYVVTVDERYAAFMAWQIKRTRAMSMFDFSSDGQSFSRSQLVANCQAMCDRYAPVVGF